MNMVTVLARLARRFRDSWAGRCAPPLPSLFAIGCCALLIAHAPSFTSADSPDLVGTERIPVEAPRPPAVSFRESASAAYWHLSAGDTNGARALILATIAAHPNDAGRNWRKYMPPAGRNIPDSPELRAALKDMPELAEFVQRRPDVYEWLSFAFSGFGSEPVVWEDAPPYGSWGCSSRNSDGKLCVQIRRMTTVADAPDVPRSGEELLAALVFELFNVQSIDSCYERDEKARLGKISRNAYVRETVDSESEATELTRAFFANVLLAAPYRSELSTREQAAAWWLLTDDEYWSELCDPRKSDANAYPWFPYGYHYDEVRAYEFAMQGKHRKAVEILARMRRVDEPDASGKARAHLLTAYCHRQLGQFAPALKHATAAIRLHPSADAYKRRARIFWLVGRKQDAADDRQKAAMLGVRELFGGRGDSSQ